MSAPSPAAPSAHELEERLRLYGLRVNNAELTADDALRIANLLRAGQKLYLTAEGCPHCCNDDGVDEWKAAHD